MTQEEIIEMARKVYGECDWHESALVHLEAFAKLVAECEREACAKVCEEWESDEAFVVNIAEAIRARGQ